MNLFKIVDIFIGGLTYRYLVRNEARGFLRMGYTEPEALTKIIYSRRSKTWKYYGIGIEKIRPIVESVCEIKPLVGWKLKIATVKARSTIRNAIKQKRLIFLSPTKIDYVDKNLTKYRVSFEELADRFIEATKQGFKKQQILKIIQEEYRRVNKGAIKSV